jgi:hypothetical protein
MLIYCDIFVGGGGIKNKLKKDGVVGRNWRRGLMEKSYEKRVKRRVSKNLPKKFFLSSKSTVRIMN